MSTVTKKIAISCINLIGGGGVQVAVSFLDELSRKRNCLDLVIHLFLSRSVYDNLAAIESAILNDFHYEIIEGNDFRSVRAFYKSLDRMGYEVLFKVFGPIYYRMKHTKTIVGFAQPWILFPRNEIYTNMGWIEKFKIDFKYKFQKRFFEYSDIIITEASFAKIILENKLGFRSADIMVVRNCVSSIYYNKSTWQPLDDFPENRDLPKLTIGVIGRDYPHKNFDILTALKSKLETKYQLQCVVVTTLSGREMSLRDPEFRREIQSVGEISVNQCPSFYNSVDMVVFPTFLECFSATPLESMIMNKAIVVSDRVFNREICLNYATYFDPNSADDLALKVYETYLALNKESTACRDEFVIEAQNHARDFSSAIDRADQYIDIIRSCLD